MSWSFVLNRYTSVSWVWVAIFLYGFRVRVNSHEAVKRLLGMHLVKPGLLSAELAVSIRKEQDDRFLADYDVTFDPGPEQTGERVREAREFLRSIEDFLRNKEAPGKSADRA